MIIGLVSRMIRLCLELVVDSPGSIIGAVDRFTSLGWKKLGGGAIRLIWQSLIIVVLIGEVSSPSRRVSCRCR